GKSNKIVLLSPFYFSSRRRHTRFSRDWSSDVCSSDLKVFTATLTKRVMNPEMLRRYFSAAHSTTSACRNCWILLYALLRLHDRAVQRFTRLNQQIANSRASYLKFMPTWIRITGIALLFYASVQDHLSATHFSTMSGRRKK